MFERRCGFKVQDEAFRGKDSVRWKAPSPSVPWGSPNPVMLRLLAKGESLSERLRHAGPRVYSERRSFNV